MVWELDIDLEDPGSNPPPPAVEGTLVEPLSCYSSLDTCHPVLRVQIFGLHRVLNREEAISENHPPAFLLPTPLPPARTEVLPACRRDSSMYLRKAM